MDAKRLTKPSLCYAPLTMVSLLTFAAYGTWLAGPARGWVERQDRRGGDDLPEPDPGISALRRRGLKWPPVRLDRRQRELLLDDLHRIAGLRGFALLAAVAAEDHVHVVLGYERQAATPDIHRLIQLIKGALSRRLSVAAGDRPAVSVAGQPLPHHKWWTRQYSLRSLGDQAVVERVCERLAAHGGEVATYLSPDLSGWRFDQPPPHAED